MKVKILGSGQDDGIPHTGCDCAICTKAKRYGKLKRLGPSIAVFDKNEGFCYLIDASPDFKQQLDMIYREIGSIKRKGKIPISGILLTHAHIGHYIGLLHLGREAIDERNLDVYCTQKMSKFLSHNYPFKFLVERRNITISEIYPGKEFGLPGFSCKPIQVPHRDEIGDTVGFIIKFEKSVIYIPDIDHWTEEVIKEIEKADIAMIDGTFYTQEEISRYEAVPHPPIKETVKLLKDTKTEIYFTHLNHTNLINQEGSEKRYIEDKGFKIAYDGLVVDC